MGFKTLLLLFTFPVYFWLFASSVLADSTGVVKAVVTVGVCGDFEKNGSEDCDNLDLGGATCSSLGFVGGELSCTSACTFNTLNCNLNSFDGEVLGTSDFATSTVRISPSLPLKLNFYDSDNNGYIEKSEISYLINKWNFYSKSNQNLCDVNNDKVCDLRDISRVLYYVER